MATSIQASRIIARVAADLDAAASRLFPETLGRSDADAAAAAALTTAGTPRTVHATMAGYVQAIDGDRLIAAAREGDAWVRLHVAPGAFVRRGSVLMTVCADTFTHDWSDAFRDVVMIGAERTGTQDIEFFINQLVELAVRALSPGINDPATARSCIDRLEHALSDLASRRFPAAVRFDTDHAPRVVARPVMFAALVDSAFAEIGRYGESSVSVTCRLLDAVGNIAACVQRDGDRRSLLAQASAIVERSRRLQMASLDRAGIEERFAAARATLGAGDDAR